MATDAGPAAANRRPIDLIDEHIRKKFRSSAAFAAACPTISASRLSNWRGGKGEPSVGQAAEMADVLGLTLAELLGDGSCITRPSQNRKRKRPASDAESA